MEIFESQLKDMFVLLLENIDTKIKSLLKSKGFKSFEVENDSGIGKYVIYESDTCRIYLIPLHIKILELIGALGGAATLYRAQKFLRNCDVANNTIKYRLRQLCELNFVKKKYLKNEADRVVKVTYELAEI